MKEKFFIVHVLDGGEWSYPEAYKKGNKYYRVDNNKLIKNQKIYDVKDGKN